MRREKTVDKVEAHTMSPYVKPVELSRYRRDFKTGAMPEVTSHMERSGLQGSVPVAALILLIVVIGAVAIWTVHTMPSVADIASARMGASDAEDADSVVAQESSATVSNVTFVDGVCRVRVDFANIGRPSIDVDVSLIDEAGETLTGAFDGRSCVSHVLAYAIDTSSGSASIVAAIEVPDGCMDLARRVRVHARDYRIMNFDEAATERLVAEAKSLA